MSMRAFELPGDIPVLVEVLPPSFQYPENDEWSIQEDEAEGMVDSLNGIRGIWPLIRLVGVFWPPMRDVMRGFIWEEDGQAVGVTNVLRRGATDQWLIGNVSVLPEYRRRGIARKLVEASVDYARERGASQIVLDVVDGNVPAVKLYDSLGFTCFSGESQLIYEDGDAVDVLPLPDDYRLEPSGLFDWRPAYQLAGRITPESVRLYKPVEPGSHRQPQILRPFTPLIFRAVGSRPHGFNVRRASDGQIVARIMCNARLRAGGTNRVAVTLDPAHGAIAPALVTLALAKVLELAPGRRVELAVAHWQRPTINAALGAGFRMRYDYVSMGIVV